MSWNVNCADACRTDLAGGELLSVWRAWKAAGLAASCPACGEFGRHADLAASCSACGAFRCFKFTIVRRFNFFGSGINILTREL